MPVVPPVMSVPEDTPLLFSCREVEWELLIEPAVLRHFARHRQIGPRAPEVGGQLFASFEKFRVRVTAATGPRDADRRSRFSFFPDRSRENAEIKERFARGLHYVGDWHTHPEPHPSPSSLDLESMRECFRNSTHSLSHFVMIIVGQDPSLSGLWVSLHTAKKYVRMNLVSTPASSSVTPSANATMSAADSRPRSGAARARKSSL